MVCHPNYIDKPTHRLFLIEIGCTNWWEIELMSSVYPFQFLSFFLYLHLKDKKTHNPSSGISYVVSSQNFAFSKLWTTIKANSKSMPKLAVFYVQDSWWWGWVVGVSRTGIKGFEKFLEVYKNTLAMRSNGTIRIKKIYRKTLWKFVRTSCVRGVIAATLCWGNVFLGLFVIAIVCELTT